MRTISSMKREMKEKVENVADGIDPDLRKRIIQEGIKVFENNNKIIKSVRGVDIVFLKKVLTIILTLVCIILLWYWIF